MPKAVGIDLGTTNSVVSTLEAGDPVVIPNAEGSRTTPSVVAFAKDGEVLVGEVAKRQAVTNADRTIRSVKRHMGTNWTMPIDGKDYTSQEISARILMKLKRDAESYLGDSVTQAVITVPAYFDDAQRTATQEALIRKPIKELVEELDSEVFWQIHRSTVVNLHAIAKVIREGDGRPRIRLRDCPEVLEVSRNHSGLFRGM